MKQCGIVDTWKRKSLVLTDWTPLESACILDIAAFGCFGNLPALCAVLGLGTGLWD